MTWRWTCTVCPETGSVDNLDEMERGEAHAASHTSGPFDIVPTLFIESIPESAAQDHADGSNR